MNDHAKMADHWTLGAVAGYIGSWLVDATPVLQALALVASIIAACVSIYYHVKRGHK